MNINKHINNLKEYINEDEIYTCYKTLGTIDGDFDMYCVEHCQDIEELVNAYTKLKTEKEALFDALIAVKEKKNRDKLVYRRKAKEYRTIVKKTISMVEEELDYCINNEDMKQSVYFLELILNKLKGE